MGPTPVVLRLHSIRAIEAYDVVGDAEPYLWTVFFKIDGTTCMVDHNLVLQGTATVVTTPGSHGNLGVDGVHGGQSLNIPTVIGQFETELVPIPLSNPQGGVTHLPGVIGCMAILMEQDETPDDAATAGHDALNAAVRDALNNLIPTLNAFHQEPTDEDINALKKKIGDAVTSAIEDNVGIWDLISGVFNEDDEIGDVVFKASQADIDKAFLKGISLFEEWQTEGDWQIMGSIHAVISSAEITCVHKVPRLDPHGRIKRVGGTYNDQCWRMTPEEVRNWLQLGVPFHTLAPNGDRAEVEYYVHTHPNETPPRLSTSKQSPTPPTRTTCCH